ncbi:uncharacterized protein LOC126853228 [Cataglyphis hispanica]|uniref:uncharacterized protein LOC126853228 n=1 Tax=Cataglyphis hispanica TaxID=1086592 RepID=UPI00217F2315|nr:uncharacterized protein LOC126853228 [Cataglyphis hispanica]
MSEHNSWVLLYYNGLGNNFLRCKRCPKVYMKFYIKTKVFKRHLRQMHPEEIRQKVDIGPRWELQFGDFNGEKIQCTFCHRNYYAGERNGLLQTHLEDGHQIYEITKKDKQINWLNNYIEITKKIQVESSIKLEFNNRDTDSKTNFKDDAIHQAAIGNNNGNFKSNLRFIATNK